MTTIQCVCALPVPPRPGFLTCCAACGRLWHAEDGIYERVEYGMATRHKTVSVLERDKDASVARWKRKGWTVMRVTPGPKVHRTDEPTVILHVQKG